MVIIRCEPERRRRARRSLCTDLSTAPIRDREHRVWRCANDGRDSLLPRELSSALSWKGPWRCCSAQLSQACMPHVAVGEPGDLGCKLVHHLVEHRAVKHGVRTACGVAGIDASLTGANDLRAQNVGARHRLARQQRTGAHLPCLPNSGIAVACSPYAGVLYALVKPPPCPPERTRAATCGARGAAGRRVTVVARAIVTVTANNGTIWLSREVARSTSDFVGLPKLDYTRSILVCYKPLYFNRKSGGLKHHHEPRARLDGPARGSSR